MGAEATRRVTRTLLFVIGFSLLASGLFGFPPLPRNGVALLVYGSILFAIGMWRGTAAEDSRR
ncbi:MULTISPECIES: hypothetical protein [Natrinema]|uniref:Uncharacterized protein n=1 Tax=Natrinema gari JCM 14663 TaxID=1230459 RepID=L9ZAJ6_9EURY|nr:MULTISPECIES: hypothetical protein [Natrinema]AFO56704.1 hypothetical protein NJ7G_1458 [Natrinema sp. J7-2]ELY82642.1 hypothetical protein C486_04438 [Natrinema gari JCM 14663]